MRQEKRPSVRLNRREFVRLLGAGALGAAVLSACSGKNDTYVVKIDANNHFVPGSLIVPVGSVVIWQNTGLQPNTVTCDPTKVNDQSHTVLPQDAQPWDSGVLYPGQTWSYSFATPGDYIYFSRSHEANESLGSIKVTA